MAWWAWLLAVWRNRREIGEAAEEVSEVIEGITSDAEPAQPRTYQANEHVRRQIDAATSHKVAPCRVPPDGWVCSRGAGHAGPCAASQKPVDRDANTPPAGRPRPPLPPSKRSQ